MDPFLKNSLKWTGKLEIRKEISKPMGEGSKKYFPEQILQRLQDPTTFPWDWRRLFSDAPVGCWDAAEATAAAPAKEGVKEYVGKIWKKVKSLKSKRGYSYGWYLTNPTKKKTLIEDVHVYELTQVITILHW